MGGNFQNRGKSKTALERLDRSHRRVEERLAELSASAAAIAGGEQIDEHWPLVEEVLSYLQRASLRHEQDEEDSVFPRLRQHAALRPLLDRLTGDHRSQRKLVAKLAKLVSAAEKPATGRALVKLSTALSASYQDHIEREDRQLLPAIARHISSEEQAEIAKEMAARRRVL